MNKTGAVLLALCASALAALYIFARPQPELPPPQPAAAAAPQASAREFEFEIAGGKVRGPLDLSAREGERITLRVRSDVADELHVHGYDLGAPLPAGEVVALNFIAAKAGRFEVELHHANLELGALEIHPR